MSGSTQVLVCGYYGFGNAGDEAILSVLIDDLNRVIDRPRITVVGGSIEAVAADHQVDAVFWRDLPAITRAAVEADLMVLGGGGLFQDQQPFDPETILTPGHGGMSYWAGFALLARLAGTPLAIYAAGVGPLGTPDGRTLTALAFQAAAAATVRDRASADLLQEMGLAAPLVTADPVFALRADPVLGGRLLAREGIERDDGLLVAAVVRPWGDGSHREALAEQLDLLVSDTAAQIVFVPFQASPHRAENDAAAALDVLAGMKHKDRARIVRGSHTPEDRMSMLGAADLVVGMRLHSVIMAARSGVPVVALAYDPKVRAVMTALGAGEMALGLDNLAPLSDLARRARADEDLRATVTHNAASLARAAEGNAQVLASVLAMPPAPADALTQQAGLVALRQLEVGFSREESEQTRARLKDAEAERDRLQREWDHLVGSRSLRLVNSWWTLRNRLRRPAATPAVETEARRADLARELARILDDHRDAVGFVVYPPTIGWAAQLLQRPQQMARAFARLGYLVFFGVERWEPGDIDGFRYAEDRVCLVGLAPEHRSVLRAIPNPLMVSYVYNFPYRHHLTNPTTIFEHIDHLDVFAQTYPVDALEQWYREAATGADVAVASARDLQAEMLAFRPDVILCPNGVTFEHFAGYRPGPPPDDLGPALSGAKPVIGYYGALAEWVDYALIDEAAARLPQFNFVFIGPDYDGSMRDRPVFRRPNVWWLGPRDYAVLPAYLHRFTVATIPFMVNEVTHAVSPLKLFEYMAGGKPVVTTALRECRQYEEVLIARDADEWVGRLIEAEVRSRDADFVQALRRTARSNTWDQRVGALVDAAARAR